MIYRYSPSKSQSSHSSPLLQPSWDSAQVLEKSHQIDQGNPSRGEGVVKALGLLLSLSQMSPGHQMRRGCSSSIPRTHCPSCRELSRKTWSSQTQLPTHTVLCWLILDVFQLSEGEIGGISFSYKSLCNWKCYLSSQKPCPLPSLSHPAKPSKLLSLESSGNSQHPCHRDCQNPGMGFAKASAVTHGIISVVSLLGRKLLVAALCLSELSVACYSRTVAVHYKFILRDHMLKASSGSPEHPGRETLMG